jgi:RNA polymerase sigma factor (sigma-70 family)
LNGSAGPLSGGFRSDYLRSGIERAHPEGWGEYVDNRGAMAAGETAARTLMLPRARLRLLSDERLARLARRGDQRAFEAIFRRYRQQLYRFCRGILADPDEAQDAFQSTMEAALRALPDEPRQIALRAWLFRVAYNESISILRRRPRVADPVAVPDWREPVADSQTEPRERLRQLVADLHALPDRQRGALVMRELSGLGYPEIAQALDASQAAARQVVYEARLALREVARGREMECDLVRRALSERDGRILRGRQLRTHLHACQGCRDFRSAIARRRSDLQSLCPPLPAAAASGLFPALLGKIGKAGMEGTGTGAGIAGAGGGAAGTGAGIAGAGGGAAGTGAGIAATSVASSSALKATSMVAAVAIGAGTAGVTGTVHLPLGRSDNPAPVATPARETEAPATRAARHPGTADDGPTYVASRPGMGQERDTSTRAQHPDHSSDNAAVDHGGQGARGAGHGRRAGLGLTKSPATPSHGAGKDGSSNHAAAPGRGRSASAPPSHSPPGLDHAASHSSSLPGLEDADSHPYAPAVKAHKEPASPAHAHGPPPGHGKQG